MGEHEYRYGNLKHVAEARVQAKGRIAARQLRTMLVDSWVVPFVEWISRRVFRG